MLKYGTALSYTEHIFATLRKKSCRIQIESFIFLKDLMYKNPKESTYSVTQVLSSLSPVSAGGEIATNVLPFCENHERKKKSNTKDHFDILIVDDEAEIGEEIGENLELHGFRCISTVDANIGLSLVEKNPSISIVIADIRMPKMNGLEFSEILLQRVSKERDIAVLIMTGHVGEEEAIRALKIGALDFLTKPVSPDSLLGAVKRAARKIEDRASERNFKKALNDLIAQRTNELRQKSSELEHVRLKLQQALENERVTVHCQKLETLGLLAGGIAHDLTTPIQFVSDNLSFLKRAASELISVIDADAKLANDHKIREKNEEVPTKCQKVDDEIDLHFVRKELFEALEESINGIRQVSSIIASIKEFSHLDSKELSLVDVNQVIKRSIAICRQEWKSVATVDLDLFDDLPKLNAHEGQINQVILNLIINAAQSIREKNDGMGHIIVSTYFENDTVKLTVEDTGIGMSDAVKERIFDPFYTTKKVGKGTGQGLALCHNIIVSNHNGHIDVATKDGHGTTFVISLPIAREKN